MENEIGSNCGMHVARLGPHEPIPGSRTGRPTSAVKGDSVSRCGGTLMPVQGDEKVHYLCYENGLIGISPNEVEFTDRAAHLAAIPPHHPQESDRPRPAASPGRSLPGAMWQRRHEQYA